jgi:type II secretory ATPase GspE/PulE/Tfp pilus assembly ATPase PilB-like protein
MLNTDGVNALLRDEKRKIEEQDAKRRAEKSGCPYLNLVSVKVPTELKALALIREVDAKKARVAPVQLVGKKLIFAVFDPEDSKAVAISDKLISDGYDVKTVVSSLGGLKHLWELYKYINSDEVKNISGSVHIDSKQVYESSDKIDNVEEFGVVLSGLVGDSTTSLLESVLGGGVALRSSDIHIEPGEDFARIRVRIDGILHLVKASISQKAHHSLVMRLKLLSGLKMNISEEAQDGRFTVSFKDYDIEIRMSVIPSEYGETVVLRILDPNAVKTNLEDLGFRSDDLAIVRDVISRPNGLVLITGPTGSGKTTTLYAFLRVVSHSENKAVTIEDPIEYHLDGISQTQVDSDSGYNFANGLRSILRQDPDVILVGEIRDNETADVALNASLTGHMVFSTLHTNDSVGAVPRLYDFKVQAQVLGSALSLVIAQRLVRVLCNKCREEVKVSDKVRSAVELFLNSLPKRADVSVYKNFVVYKSVGCDECRGVGYLGRIGVFEMFLVDETIEKLIYKKPTEIDLRTEAREQGTLTMQEDGVLKVLRGITSFDEVKRLTGAIGWLEGLL